MALANYKAQLAAIHKRLGVLNPLRATLRLPALPEVPDPLAHYVPSGNTRKDGDARHNAAIQLKHYREGLDKQIADLKKQIASGKGIGAPTVNDFYQANNDLTTTRSFSGQSGAPVSPEPIDSDPQPSEGGNGVLLAALAAGAYLLFRR